MRILLLKRFNDWVGYDKKSIVFGVGLCGSGETEKAATIGSVGFAGVAVVRLAGRTRPTSIFSSRSGLRGGWWRVSPCGRSRVTMVTAFRPFAGSSGIGWSTHPNKYGTFLGIGIWFWTGPASDGARESSRRWRR